jgi:hypothetical protein
MPSAAGETHAQDQEGDSMAVSVDRRPINQVPNPYPLTPAGMLAALGPQAINFGISIGGGEACGALRTRVAYGRAGQTSA